MTDRFRQLLGEIERPAPPNGLLDAVLGRLAHEKRDRVLRRQVMLYSLVNAALTAAFVWALVAAGRAMTGTGNLAYLKLAFSDTSLVLANWSSYIQSVFESLPAGHLAALLGVVACLMLSLRALVRTSRQAFHGHHHAFNF